MQNLWPINLLRSTFLEREEREAMLVGYMRVSTPDQNLGLQRDALIAASVAPDRICEDVCSGRAVDQPGLARALDIACDGDALVIWKLDRIGRSLPHVVGLVGDLQKRGKIRQLQHRP